MSGVLEVPAPDVGKALREIADGASGGRTARAMRDVIADGRSGRLRLAAGERAVHARVGSEWSVLVTPSDAAGRSRIVPMPTSYVPKAVLRASGVVDPPGRTPLTWTVLAAPATGVHLADSEVTVHDDGRELFRWQGDEAGWRRLSVAELYVVVIELVVRARPAGEGA